jgi:predicted dienelactone hydrolase
MPLCVLWFAFLSQLALPGAKVSTATAAEPVESADTRMVSPVVEGRPHQVGYQRMKFEFVSPSGENRSRQLDLWYPTTEQEKEHNYRGQIGFAAMDAPVAAGRHPLILFSHGFLGSSDQVIFLTESCARAGYIVAAMNHNDAITHRREQRMASPQFADFEQWTDEKFRDRQEDITALLEQILEWNKSADSPWHDHVDESLIAGMGHSLGGYTMLGMAGGWPAWKEPRFKAVVLFSPFSHPFSTKGNLEGVKIPFMLQGGTLDFGITPFLTPTYKKLGGPKVLLILKNETHFGWTNFASMPRTTIECVANGNPELIVKYTVAFFDHHLLRYDRSEVLEKENSRLELFRFEKASN